MDMEDVGGGEKIDGHGLLCELFEGVVVLFAGLIENVVEFLLAGGGGGTNDQRFAVGGDFQRGLGGDIEQLHDGFVDYQGVTVAVFCQLLDHKASP